MHLPCLYAIFCLQSACTPELGYMPLTPDMCREVQSIMQHYFGETISDIREAFQTYVAQYWSILKPEHQALLIQPLKKKK